MQAMTSAVKLQNLKFFIFVSTRLAILSYLLFTLFKDILSLFSGSSNDYTQWSKLVPGAQLLLNF
jgi:hypothetical protein